MTELAPEDLKGSVERRSPLRFLLLPILGLAVFGLLFACGSLGTFGIMTRAADDMVASKLAADYRPWGRFTLAPLSPGFLVDLAKDLGVAGLNTPSAADHCLLPDGGCDPGASSNPGAVGQAGTSPTPRTPTRTSTPSLTPTPSHTATPTRTPTPTNTPPPTATPTSTATRTPTPTNTPTPTPLVFPVKLADQDDVPPGTSNLTFEIVVINYGSVPPALLERIIDRLPIGMTISSGCSPPSCSVAVLGDGRQEVVWQVSQSIPQGGFYSISFDVLVSASAGDVLTNEVETQGSNFQTAVNWKAIHAHTPTPTPSNNPPLAVDDSYAGTEDTILPVPAPGVLGNDSDPEGDPLTATLLTGPGSGSVLLQPDGSFTYTPAAHFYGNDSFTYEACDTGLQCDPATVTLIVSPVNDPPSAYDDSYSVDEDVLLSVSAPGVLGNDSDLEGDPLTAELVAGATSGAVTLNADGSFTYQPDPDFNGADSFTYRARDSGGQASGVAQVEIIVNPINDPPTGVDDTASTRQDTAAVIDVLANDTDPESDPRSVEAILSGPSNGTLVNDRTSVTYTPNAGYVGPDSFVYQVCDPWMACGTATVSLMVNDPPLAQDDTYIVDEDAVLSEPAPGVLGNDSDPNPSHTLTAVVLTGPVYGALILNADGSLTYTPQADFFGADSFTYDACDPLLACAAATVDISVLPTNDTPVAANDAAATDEDTPVTVSVLSNDSGLGDAPISVTIASAPPRGTAAVQPDSTILYTPAPNDNGVVSFQYEIQDLDGETATAWVQVTINAVNDPPVAQDDAASTNEDAAVTVNVIANDTDVEDGGVVPTSVLITTGAANGTAVSNGDGTVTYTPDPDYFGTDTFRYTVRDSASATSNTATVTVTVNPVPDPPVVRDDAARTGQAAAVNVDVLSNDWDPDGEALSVTAIVSPPSNGLAVIEADDTITYTPFPAFTGVDVLTYRACDPGALCGQATLQIAVNDNPVALDDSYNVDEDAVLNVGSASGVLANDSDPNGHPLTANLITNVTNGALVLNANGSFTYTPDPDFYGSDGFTYDACDSMGDCDSASVTLQVNPVNDTPVAVDDNLSLNEDSFANVDVLANDSGLGDAPITVVILTAPANGTAVVQPDKTITYTPAANYRGPDSLQYQLRDGDSPVPQTATATLTISVTPVNDTPVAVNNSVSTNEDTPITIDVLANDTGLGDTPITVAIVSPPANGTVVVNGSNTITYTPDPNYNSSMGGPDTFQYRVTDTGIPPELTESSTATVTVTVNPVNDAPVAEDDDYSTNEDTALVVAAPGVLSNDTDVEMSPLTALLVAGPSDGTLTLNSNGGFTYTPDPDFWGSDSFTYRARDGSLNSNVATVTLTVLPVNDVPQANDDIAITGEDTSFDIPVLTNDIGVGDTPLVVTIESGAANGSLTVLGNLKIRYSPAPDYYGPDSFSYRVTDADGEFDIASVDVTVNPANDAPTAANDGYGLNEDTTLSVAAPGVLSNDNDVDGDPLTAALVTGPAYGSLALAADGSFDYTPNPDYNGADSFTYRAWDASLGSNTATVTLTIASINDLPSAVDDSASTMQGNSVTIAVLANDAGLGDAPLAVSIASPPSNGSAVVNGDNSVTYTPGGGFSGSDSFDYTVTDGNGDASTATVTITVTPAPTPTPVPPVLQVVKQVNPTSASVGDVVEFTIYLWNKGPGSARNVILSDSLGGCFQFLGPDPSGIVGNLAEGEARIWQFTAQVVGSGSCGNANTVSITSNNAVCAPPSCSHSASVSIAPSGPSGRPSATPSQAPTITPTTGLTASPTATSPPTQTPAPSATDTPGATPTPTAGSSGSLNSTYLVSLEEGRQPLKATSRAFSFRWLLSLMSFWNW